MKLEQLLKSLNSKNKSTQNQLKDITKLLRLHQKYRTLITEAAAPDRYQNWKSLQWNKRSCSRRGPT